MDKTSKRIDALMARYRRDAVLIHRLFPPTRDRAINSWLGGLPSLPDHYEWPRTSDKVPLHFLAQIDCAEIPFSSQLPERGVLFFFAREDEEQLWGFDRPPSDDCRVIYALDAFARTPRRKPPPDLPPMGGSYGRSTHDAIGDIAPRRDQRQYRHVEWPLELYRIGSWPDASALPEEELDFRADDRPWLARLLAGGRADTDPAADYFPTHYSDRLDRLRAAEVEAATGVALGSGRWDKRAAGNAIFGPADQDGPFPEYWIYIHYFARLVIHRDPYQINPETQAGLQLDAAARDWLERTRHVALEDRVPDNTRRAFRAWAREITFLLKEGRWTPRPADEIVGAAAEYTFGSAVWAIRSWAHDPALAARIPPAIYAATEQHLASDFVTETTDYDGQPKTDFDFQFAQMLGHAPSTQQARDVSDPTLCLLCLRSDRGVPWMFADVGECTFWIAPDDLARRDFSKVRLTIEGG